MAKAWSEIKASRFPAERLGRIRRDAAIELIALKELRRVVGATQVEIAERSGMDQAEVSRIENGQDARLSTLRKYAAGLGAELDIGLVVGGKRYPIGL